jgi:PAS domain S-box-containing protein
MTGAAANGLAVHALVPGPLAVLRVDREGIITLGEGDAEVGLGIDPRHVAGRSLFDVFRDRMEILDGVRAALAGRSSSASVATGARSLAMRFEPRRDERGRVVACAVFGIEVTDELERIARSDDRFAEAQRVAHIGSWEWDAVRNVVTWTEELYRIYALEKEQFAGTYESFLERVHPEDREYTSRVIFDAFRGVKPFVYDHRIVRPDGAVRMLHTRGGVIADSSGKPARLVGCCWDVTERWEAQRQRDLSLSLLEATLDSTDDGIFVVDLEGKIVSVNRRALALWEIPDKVAASGDVWALVDHVRGSLEDPEGFVQIEKALLADHETERLDTIRFNDGRVFERYSQPQRVGAAVVGRVCSFRDVTERERLLRSALFLSDASRLLASIEVERALEAVGRASLPLLGDACAIDLFDNGGGPRRLLSLTLPTAEPASTTLPPGVLSGKSSIHFAGRRSCMVAPLTVRGAVVGALTFIAPLQRRYARADLDLVEELARRAALAVENAHLHRRAQESLRARDEFFAIASHEIRGPIAAIHLAVQNLLRTRNDATKTARIAGAIERGDRRLSRLVDELYDVSQLRAGQLRFDLEDVDLGEVAREVVSRLAPEFTRSGSSLSMAMQGALVGVWDRSRIEQVIANLLSNAIKFGLGKAIEVRLKGDAERASLVVTDHGIGIEADRRDAIFEPFERAVEARHYGGLGLGLFIARTIVTGLGGTVHVESVPGQGSTFTVELPKERAP